VSAAKALDHDGMYEEHMESMLKPTGHKVEIGKRRLGNNDVQLQGKQYEGKKVSRAQLQQPESSDSSEDDAMEEFGEDSMDEQSFASEEVSSDESMGEVDCNAAIYT